MWTKDGRVDMGFRRSFHRVLLLDLIAHNRVDVVS